MSDQPNVVWLTLDSVRNDRTSLDGYRQPTTPNLKRIAASDCGQSFRNCFSHAIWSLPSDASILTGTYPSYHGTGLRNDVLPENIKTVPERFIELGYHTAGLSHNAYCSDSTGLTRGFDEFTWVHKSNLFKTAGPTLLAKYVLQLRKHGGGYTSSLDRHRLEYVTTELAKRQLSSLCGTKEPFFQFLHLQGTHIPYTPPARYRDKFTDKVPLSPGEAADIGFERSMNYYREIANECDYPPEVQSAIDAMYDGLLAYVDERVGSFFDHLRSLDLGPTILIVTADHGDLLGEHGVLGHQLSLHDGLVNVPMIVHGPTTIADLSEDRLIQHIDVMEALLRDAGADAMQLAGLQGADPRETHRRYALSQRGNDTYETAMEQIREFDPSANLDRFEPGLVHSVRDKDFKLVRSDQRGKLYDLPDEQTDVSCDYPEVDERHRSFLETLLQRIGRGRSSDDERELSDAMREQLSDLGYVTD